MNRNILTTVLTLCFLLIFSSEIYACEPLVISFEEEYYYGTLGNEIIVKVLVAPGQTVDPDSWWGGQEGLTVTIKSKSETEVVFGVTDDYWVGVVPLYVEAYSETYGYAFISIDIPFAYITVSCPSVIAYGNGMAIDYSIDAPCSLSMRVVYILDVSRDTMFLHIVSNDDGTYNWNGKGSSSSPYPGQYLPPGNYIAGYVAKSVFRAEQEFAIIDLDVTHNEYIAYETGTNLSYSIDPTEGVPFLSAWLYIYPTDYPSYTAYACQVYDLEGIIYWDGMGNIDWPYDGNYLFPGNYKVGMEVEIDNYGWFYEDTGDLTVVYVDLDADNSEDDYEEYPGTPVMLNDDWDCGVTYSTTSGGHRQYEPIWDKDYLNSTYEDDLMGVTLSVTGVDSGSAYLDITSGSDRIRLWENDIKYGSPISIPTGGKPYDITSLPQTIYVEGIDRGSAEMTLTYSIGGNNFSDTIKIDVVSLEPYQDGWTKRVINKYDMNVTFVVEPDSLSAEYSYLWDLNGDSSRHYGAWESSTSRVVSVKYSNGSSGSGNVNLPRNTDNNNHRKEYDISVELTGGLIMHKNIKVALDQYVGTALTGGGTATGRDYEVGSVFSSWNNTYPITFDNTDIPGNATQTYIQTLVGNPLGYTLRILNNGNRMLYGSTNFNAGTVRAGSTSNLCVYTSLIGPPMWDSEGSGVPAQTLEDMIASANHEKKHCEQFLSDKNNTPTNNIHRLLDIHYGGLTQDFQEFIEAEAHLTELNDYYVGWYHQISASQGDLDKFYDIYYTNCIQNLYPALPSGSTKTEARTYLQDLYNQIDNNVFLEMKRQGFDYYVRPPE